MDGSESDDVFESLNLNPHMFINETLNTVDDMLDEAFDFFLQEATTQLKDDGTDKSKHLKEGIAYIKNMMQSELDTRLGMWEQYSLHHCFAVPKGFSLPKRNESTDERKMSEDMLCDPHLDAELDSLRERLAMAKKESSKLDHELQALERQSVSRSRFSVVTAEALNLYKQNNALDMFQEVVSTMSELRTKMENLKSKRKENIESLRTKRISEANINFLTSNHSKGLSNAKLEDLQGFLADLQNL